MALQLNEPGEYKEFYGRNIDKMPELIKQGFTPLSMAQVMQRRLDVLGSTPEVEDAWWMHYFDTGDAVVYHPDGRIKVVLDSQIARELNPKSTLRNGALVLSDGMYEQMQGEEFSKEDVEKYAKYSKRESLSLKEAMNNPLWKALARDPKLLKEYAKATFKEAKSQLDSNKNMGVYTSEFKEVPNLRLWLLDSLRNYGSSNVIGYYKLGDGSGRLVGVAPNAQSARGNQASFTLDDKVKGALICGKAFKYNGFLYIPSADPAVQL
jgi:hypothetical protein